MQLLMQHGADINGKPGTPWMGTHHMSSEPPLVHAVYYNGVSTTQWMLEQGAEPSPALAAAARAGNLPVFRLLLGWGADISTWGGLAFRLALANQCMGIACLLLGAGPPDYFMSAAPPHPHIELDDIGDCVRSFLEDADDEQASALLQAAVQHGHTEFAQMLQQEGVTLPTGELHAQALQQEA
jgi:ankyrin repeat protein